MPKVQPPKDRFRSVAPEPTTAKTTYRNYDDKGWCTKKRCFTIAGISTVLVVVLIIIIIAASGGKGDSDGKEV